MTEYDQIFYDNARKLKYELTLQIKGNVTCWYNEENITIEIRLSHKGVIWGMSIGVSTLMNIKEEADYIVSRYKHDLNDEFFK